MLRRLVIFAAALAVLVAGLSGPMGSSWAQSKKKKKDAQAEEEEIDYISLAARLYKDERYDRAAAQLAQVDLKKEGLDLQRYHLLMGLISLKRSLYKEAVSNFEKLLEIGGGKPEIFLYLGQAKFNLRDFEGAIEALEKAGPEVRTNPSAMELLAQAYWQAEQPGAALTVAAEANKKFTDTSKFARLEIFYLVKLGLYQELARRSATFVDRDDIEPQDLAAIADSLRESGRLDEAQRILEAARLRFPDETVLDLALAATLLDKEQTLAAAMLYESVARLDPDKLIEAAELYRRAGRLERALYINARVADQKKKMRQRLQILLQMERFESIAAMEVRLSRLGLLEDEQIRYALAYGYFELRDFDASLRHIRRLESENVFQNGVELRKAIQQCNDAGWQCR